MKIRWTGSKIARRLVDGFEWSQAAGFVQDVPEELALELLTAPGERFEQVDDAPDAGAADQKILED